MKNFKLNLKGLYGYRQSLLSRSPQPRDNREMSERRPSEERTLLAPLPQRFARYAAMLMMLLTLGVGQMWANGGGFYGMYINYTFNSESTTKGVEDNNDTKCSQTYNLGTLTSGDFTVNAVYLKCWDDWESNYKSNGGLLGYNNKGGANQELLSFTKTSKTGNNYEWNRTSVNLRLASPTDASGSYSFVCWGKTWWSGGDGNIYSGDHYYPNVTNGNYTFNYTILPPTVSSFSVSESNHLSGSGTEVDPYIIPYNGTLSLSISGSQEHTDANSSAQYYNTSTSDNWSATATKSISSITSTTKTSVTVKMRYYNSTAKLAGTESSETIWYQSEVSYNVTAATGGHGTVTPTSATAMGKTTGGDIIATPSTGYNFTSWAISSGSGYFGSTGTATTSTTANTKFRPSAAATVTATFTAKQTTVTLNKNTPDGQTVSGDASVTATYDAALPDFTALTCTGGYSLTGYWSESSGGTRIINADGTFAANSGIWNREDGATLDVYAQWSADPGVSLSAAKTSSINVGETIRLTATGRNAANITRYEFYLGEDLAYTATTSSTTATYDYVVNTTGNKSFTVKMYYNSGSNNITSSAEVLTLNTPTISLTSSKTTGINVGETITLTATASNLSPSATNKITYKFYEGSTLKATETVNSLTQTYSYTPTTTGNKTMKVTIDILEMATKTSSNVSLTLNTPSVSLAVKAGSPSNFYLGEGSTILKATPSNVGAGVTPSYVFTDQIAGGVTSASQTGTEWTYNPSVSGQAKARTMKVTMTVGGSTYNATVGITVYEKWNIYVKNNCSWPLGVYYYGYGDGISASWPGTACSVYRGSWYTVTLDNKYPYFILGNGYADSGKRQLKGDNTYASNIATYPAGTGYTFTYGGKLDGDNNEWYSLTEASLPVAPTVTTNSISTYDVTTATLGGNITNDGGDNTTSYGYYYSTNSALSSSNLGVGTCVEVGTGTKTGSYSKSQTDLSAGTTYYVLAYATNGFGTGYGTVQSFTTKVTVNFGTRTGGNDPTVTANAAAISSGASVAKGATVVFTANKQDGYTFNAWYDHATAGSSVSTDNPYTIASIASNTTLYSTFTENKTAITITTDGHGTITTPNPNESPYNLGVATTQAINASPNTGYHWNTWTVSGNADLVSAAATQSNTAKGNGTAGGTGTVTATFSPNTYSVTFDANGGTGDAMSPQAFTYDVAQALSTNTYTRTGYDFDGWATEADGEKVYDPAQSVNNLTATDGGTFPLFAHWTAKSYTVTLDKQTDVTGYGGTEGTVANQTVTFDATPATVSGTMPSAANGYCFMGFYSATGGNGRCFIDPSGNWVTSAGDTISGGNWVKPAGITLYAYYKKAEITEVTLSTGSTVAPSTTGITATATLAPTPAGTTHIDWRILYSNDNPLATQPNFGTGTTTNSFTAPETSGTYKLEATLRTGNTPNSGTVLDSYVLTFQVAGDHTVTVQYKCGDEVIRASASVTGKPLASTEITAPDIVGYTFSKWKAGDGITIDGADGNGEKASATINFTAIYDGKLTAIYTKKQMIYFNNTLGWEDVWVYFYNDASGNKYWANNYGTGANKQQPFNNNHPYWEQEHGQMTQIEGTDIWYFDFQSEDWYSTTRTKVAFVNKDQSIDISGASNDEAFFHNASVIYREDFDATNLPMFVPIDAVEYDYTINTGSKYYRGYWMNYPESTGYTLKIYNKKTNDGSDPAEIRSIPFEFTADKTMPMELDVDLEAGKTYGFKIYCNNDTWLGNNGTMTATTPNWDLSTGTSNCGLTTTAAGNYKFTLNYFAVSSTDYKLRIGVTYPVAAGDYQVLYKDDTMSKWFISAVVPAASDKDTVSFFVRKNENPVLKLQKCSSVGTGTVTWSDTVANLISVLPSAITQDSVYIFCLNKNAEGKRALGDVKAYTGNYYIRTDCAGTTKWDNYRAADHLMTYSEYSETYSDFTHYFVAHVESGNNVKFVVANDYSPNISDTLEISTYRGGDGDHIEEGGNIKANANVRFMWDRRKNAVYRAYLDEAKSDGSRFLVLRANSSEDLMDENGNPLTSGNNHGAPDNSIQFVDNENWIYETNVMVKPSAYVKLYGHFHGQDFYFKGESGDDFNGEDGDSDGIANAIQLMTGTGGAQKVRVIYDFKTDRLLAAWMPSGEIDGEHKINADVMFVREGQGDIAQLVFVDEDLDGKYGSITAIKSAYGVMRFNKWTLNNKDKDTHTVLSSPASIYERSLFWISFPFRVKLSEVFGFGTYGVDWAIQRYDGAERAEKGFWAESSGFWKWMDRNTEYLEPDQGYLLAIDLDLLGESASVWNNGVENVELYFPSYGTMPSITSANVEHTLPSHACTIDWSGRSNGNGGTLGSAYNRTVIDSHWNVMSVPTYVNTSNIAFANTTWTNTIGPNFLYTWNASDNTLTPTAGAGYHYHAMHAYMVQYHEGVTWTASSGSPYSSIVARRTYAEQPKKVNFCLEIQQNEKMIDRTFVQLSDDEEVSAEFSFGEDMGKEFNSRKANIYTVIEGYLQAAGNTLPMSDQTTLVPVGVKTTAAGEYTFAMPEGTSGVSVVLIDNIAGTRTNLALSDYTVALGKGDLSDRFMLEIAPIKQMPTDIENVQGGDVQGAKARKVMVDGILYIVKDGKVFDARGAKVK